MKPRITLAETYLTDGTHLVLQEHDGRYQLLAGADEISGPRTRHSEMELGRIACAPFRPVRQPRIWICGLGLGHVLEGVTECLIQKKGHWVVAEPTAELIEWHRRFFPEGPVAKDSRIEWVGDPGPAGLAQEEGALHAVLLHADVAPTGEKARPWCESPRWMDAAARALLPGGLIAIASSREMPSLEKHLRRRGLEVVVHSLVAQPHAKRSRSHYLYLGKKDRLPEA